MEKHGYDFLEIGINRKIIIGLIALLALILLGYNASEFMAIYDTPLIGASYESRLASDKWMRFSELDSEKKNTPWDEKTANLIIEPQTQGNRVEEDVSTEKPLSEPQYIRDVLPGITGIVRISGSNSNTRSAVIVENKTYYEKDTVDGFYIKEITENGIYLTKGKRDWFIDAPRVFYSLDRGD
jgi:hypothetical protein